MVETWEKRDSTFTMPETVLPSYFPLKSKSCAIPADSFFACFDTESQYRHPKEALLSCQEQLGLYKTCMEKYFKNKA